MSLPDFTSDEFLQLGLRKMGFSDETIRRNKASTNVDRFKDNYYVKPCTCAKLFVDIQSEDLGDARINNPKPLYLLLALFYLKKYPTKIMMAAFTDGCHKTALMQSRKYVVAIQALMNSTIRWIFDDVGYDEIFIISVDGIHCPIFEPRTMPSSGWYSKKVYYMRLAWLFFGMLRQSSFSSTIQTTKTTISIWRHQDHD